MSKPANRPKIPKRVSVTFKGPDGSEVVEAKADTGADRTTIDHIVAKKIGAGPVEKVVQVNQTERRVVVPVVVELAGIELAVSASVSDRRGLEYPDSRKKSTDALLGEPLLEQFGVYPGWESDELTP
jgi:hypothetical protein